MKSVVMGFTALKHPKSYFVDFSYCRLYLKHNSHSKWGTTVYIWIYNLKMDERGFNWNGIIALSSASYHFTFESQLSSVFTACPFSTKMSTTLISLDSMLMSRSTRMTPCTMEYTDTKTNWPLTNERKSFRAWVLHLFPRIIDLAEGLIPASWNSMALDHEEQ